MRKYTLLAVLAGLLAIAPAPRADDALYKRLGGKKAITAVVDNFAVASLDKFMVKEGDKQALLGVLGPMKKDIVEK